MNLVAYPFQILVTMQSWLDLMQQGRVQNFRMGEGEYLRLFHCTSLHGTVEYEHILYTNA